MLTPRHKGRGRWVVVDGDNEVAGPFSDKTAADAHIAAQAGNKAAPEIGAAAVMATSEGQRLGDKRADFLAERQADRLNSKAQQDATTLLFEELRAAVLKHAGEEAAYRCEQELWQLARDPLREARRRLRIRDMNRLIDRRQGAERTGKAA